MTPINEMTIEQIRAELAGYRPGNQAEVVTIEEWMARRMQLWRRLDTLTRPGGGGQPEKQVR